MLSPEPASQIRGYVRTENGVELHSYHFTEPETWSDALQKAVKLGELSVIPYELKLDYDHWNYRRHKSKHWIKTFVLTFCQTKSLLHYCQRTHNKKYHQVSP
jgi:hypothetical protein